MPSSPWIHHTLAVARSQDLQRQVRQSQLRREGRIARKPAASRAGRAFHIFTPLRRGILATPRTAD
jgi:hypothetical protein